MYYSRLADTYEELEKTPAKLKKSGIIAGLLKETEAKEMEMAVLLLQGKVFPIWSEKELGIADKTALRIVSAATGFPEVQVAKSFNETGDLGLTVEKLKLIGGSKQKTLGAKHLDIENVFESLRKLASIEGKGSQDVKVSIVKELVMHSSPRDAKYIIRTALGELRIGVAEGIIRDAIAEAFLPEEKEATSAIEWAWFLTGDYGEVACIAKEKGLAGLKKVRLEIGKPIQVLLAEKSPSLEEALDSFEEAALEFKYDGARVQVHRKGERIWLYTRRLENITKQFPDLVELVKKHVKGSEFIIEGEILAIDPRSRRPMTFQTLSQRIHRKYDIEDIAKQIPIQAKLFDVIYLDGKSFFETPFKERRKILESMISEVPGKFQMAEELITKDLNKAEQFYRKALEANQEGVMVKNMKACYQPGRRVAGGWLKVKPTMENLDLAIIGAQWGTGKRAGWMGSFMLGARDEKTGRFLECGMIGTGIREKEAEAQEKEVNAKEGVTFVNLTKLLKPYIESEKGSSIKIRPKVVVEVAYEEIQKSPNYGSGYALRFPRVVRLRTSDKGPEQADTLERLKRLYGQQKG